MIYLELLLLMWLITSEHSILLASANKHPYKQPQIRQMKTDNITKFNNILANADYPSVFLADCPNYAYHSFMEIYTKAFNRACPENPLKHQKYMSKLLKNKLKKPTEQNINAFKKYCMTFDKVKKMAKESYFKLELEKN